MRSLVLALAAVAGFAISTPTHSAISLQYSVTDLGGSYQYDFTLIADNFDGSFVDGMGWDWIIIGDSAYGDPAIFPERSSFFTSLPSGWGAAASSGGSNGPTLAAVDGRVVGDLWTPSLGESVSFSGVSTNFVGEGELLWSSLITRNGATRFTRREAQLAPIPLPAALPILALGLGGLAFYRRRRDD